MHVLLELLSMVHESCAWNCNIKRAMCSWGRKKGSWEMRFAEDAPEKAIPRKDSHELEGIRKESTSD
jgi:hypothetical protein